LVSDDRRKQVEAVLFLAMFLGLTLVAVRPVSGGSPVPPTTTVTVPVPYSICVIQFGVQESGGTITWLPGYSYPDIPISQCQNETGVFGQDVLGRTIMFHQFILNGTAYVTITTTVTSTFQTATD
jgi:hypothetical protein